MHTQEQNQRPLFPHPPVQRFNPPVIPQIGANTLGPQEEEHKSREHFRKLPQNQIKEMRTPMSKQIPHQRSCQDVRMAYIEDVARPVFVNHYYAGEVSIPATSKKLIKLDECEVSTENSLRNIQQQGAQHKYGEHSQNLWMAQQQTRIEKGQVMQQQPFSEQ